MKRILTLITVFSLIFTMAAVVSLHTAAEDTGSPPSPSTEVTATEAIVPTDTPAPTEYEVIDHPVITDFENQSNGTKITWNRYGNEAYYRVYYRKASSYSGTWDDKYAATGWTRLSTVKGNSFVHTGVSNGEVGIYTVRCVDAKGDFTSSFFSQGWENCYYAPPSITSIRFGEDGVRLSWTQSWKEHGSRSDECYRVYRKTDEKSWTRIADQLTDNSYYDDTAVPGTDYIYTVRLVTEDGTRFLSDYLSGKRISFTDYPLMNSIENTDKGVKLSWKAYGGAAQYRVYYRSSDGWTRIAQTSSTVYLDTSAKSGESRIYTVRALNARNSFISGYKQSGWSNTYFSSPLIHTLTNTTDGVKLMWDRVEGAEDYRVYRKTTDGWVRLAQTDEDHFTDTSVVSGAKYTYTIRMVSRDGERFMSDYLSGKSITYVAAPVITDVSNLSDGAKITWSAVPGADSYRIYYRGENGWIRLASKYLPEYVDRTVTNGQAREYTVRCLDKNDNFISDYFANGTVNTYYAPPAISELEVTDSGVVVSWKRAEGSEDYRLYRRTSGEGWTRLVQTDQSRYVDDTAQNGVACDYTIRMVTADGSRFMSYYNEGKTIIPCKTPLFSSAENAEHGATLRWEPVEDAYIYRIYYRSDSQWTRIGATAGTSFTDDEVKDGESRTYTIRCVDKNGYFCSDFDRGGLSHTYTAPPVIDSVDYDSANYTILWSDYPGAASYRLYRRQAGETDYTLIKDDLQSTFYTDTDNTQHQIYSYTLEAIDKNGVPIGSYRKDTPFYYEGDLADGVITVDDTDYLFADGQPVSGFIYEIGKLHYYSNGVQTVQDWYQTGQYQTEYTRAQWLYALLKAKGCDEDLDPDNEVAVFERAQDMGLIAPFTATEIKQAVTRRFAADTLFSALGYPKRSVGTLSDITADDAALDTLAYYGYFLPDSRNRIFPEAAVTAAEFDRLLCDMQLYYHLRGKTVISFGDSIMYGAGNDNQGIAQITAEKYGMYYHDYSVKGSAMGEAGGRGHIPDQIRRAIADKQQADIILLNGGTNDTFSTDLGTLLNGYDMSDIDESSFTGGLEKALWMIKSNRKNTPVIYIRPHKMPLTDEETERVYGERGVETAKKWNAAVIDLYRNSDMNTRKQSISDRYTYPDPDRNNLSDSIHPNALGYASYYLPPLSNVLSMMFDTK